MVYARPATVDHGRPPLLQIAQLVSAKPVYVRRSYSGFPWIDGS